MIKIYNQKYALLGGVYKIYNVKNNRIYIGSTRCFEERFGNHLKTLNNQTHHNKYLQNCYNKHCTDDYIFDIIEIVEGDKLARTTVEQIYLNLVYDKHKNCYNIRENVVEEDASCYAKDPESRNKIISEKNILKWQDPVYKELHKEKLKIASLKPETIKRRSNAAKTRWNNGVKEVLQEANKKHWEDPENRKIHSETCKKRPPLTQEARDKISNGNKGKKLSEEHLEIFLAANLAYSRDPDNRKAKSDRMKNFWNDPDFSKHRLSKIKERCKPIISININTKEKIYHESVVEASKYFCFSESSIRDVLKHRVKYAKNNTLIFEYISKEEYQNYLDSL